jgi:hypothetical protein
MGFDELGDSFGDSIQAEQFSITIEAISMGIVGADGMANDLRALEGATVRFEAHFVGGPEDASLYGFEAITDIREGAVQGYIVAILKEVSFDQLFGNYVGHGGT